MNSADCNTYSYAADAARTRFAAFVDGAADPAVGVISSEGAGNTARAALTASFDRLGYGHDACAFVAIAPHADGEETQTTSPSLTDADLYLIIESLDPQILVATDVAAAAALSRIFRAALSDRKPVRLLGRPTLPFANFAGLLITPDGKRAAWEALKQLAR